MTDCELNLLNCKTAIIFYYLIRFIYAVSIHALASIYVVILEQMLARIAAFWLKPTDQLLSTDTCAHIYMYFLHIFL